MKNNILQKKKEFRKKQLNIRENLYYSVLEVFNEHLFEQLISKFNFEDIKIVSSFISIHTEINTYQLNSYLLKKNKTLCLPVIVNKNDHLVFRKFIKGQNMIDGYMKIKEPPNTNEILFPDLLFVPCLAYDRFGYRLGYGGGYYDRTLNYFKSINKKYLSIGYAFDDQKVSDVPKDKFDIKLDYVITEKNIYSFV